MTPSTSPVQPWLEIIVPARNEALRLPAGLAELCAKAATLPGGVEVIVVDSASTDDTGHLVRHWPRGQVPVRLVRCEQPGKGAAVRAGLLATTAPYVGFCDADMATNLAALDTAIDLLLADRPVVLGSRSHAESVVEARHSLLRKAGALVFRSVARLVAPGVGDTQCGFKFFAGPLARAAARDLQATGFAFDIELISRCRQLGAEVTEVPVSWRDMPGSRFSVTRHSLTAFTEIAAIWLALRRRSVWPAPAAGSPARAAVTAQAWQAAAGSQQSPAEYGGSVPAWSESA